MDKDPNPLATGPTKWRADHCVTHHHGCDCREWEHANRVAELEQDAGKLDSLVYTTDRPVSSETVGGWSRSFGSRNLSQADMQRTETRRREIVLAYLGPTGLLKARGYGPCPCSPTP